MFAKDLWKIKSNWWQSFMKISNKRLAELISIKLGINYTF